MDRKRLMKTALGLLLAFVMAFAPLFSSYSAIAFAAGTDEPQVAAGTDEVTGNGTSDPAAQEPNANVVPADPVNGSTDTSTDTPSQEEPAADPDAAAGQDGQDATDETGAGDEGSGEDVEDPTEAEIVDNDLFVSVQPLRDDEDIAIDTAETGEKLTARFYAFNDNPNATAIAKIRVYADQVTRKTDQTAIKHENTDKIKMKGTVGDKATEIVAEWKTLKSSDPENKRGYDVEYLEFELPAGASVDCDIDLETVTGYDSEIKAEVYPEYKIADKDGNYPDKWSKPENADENKAVLTWTGEFAWDNFIKRASDTVIGYGGGKFTKDAITYSFSAENKKLNALTGVIYTDKITLEDTIKLPESLSLPEGAKVEYGKVVTANGVTIYEIEVSEYSYDFDVQIKDSKTIYYKINIPNPDIDDPAKAAAFSPMDNITSKLYLKDLVVSPDEQFADSETDPIEIDNTASLKVESVEANDGDDKQTYKYEEDGDAAVKIIADGVVTMTKEIIKVEDANGNNVTTVSHVNDEWQVKRNYKVTYQISITNTSKFDKTVNGFKDTVPKGLTVDKRSLTTKVGTASASSSKGFVGPDEGPLQIQINNFKIPAGKTGYITYTVTVAEKDYTPDIGIAPSDLPLKNVAEYDGTTVEEPVRRIPETKITIKKQVVARYTKALNGDNCVIYADWDPRTEQYKTINTIGNPSSLYKSGNSFTRDDWIAALHEFDAGDTIVYRLYLLNEGDTDFEGKITDWSPFVSNPAQNWSNTGQYYKYQASGTNYYYESQSYSSARSYSGSLADAVKSASGGTLQGGATDFTDNATSVNAGKSTNDCKNKTEWVFSGDKVLKAGHDYVQSTLLVIPGDQTSAIVSSNSGNAEFEYMVTNHASNTWNSSTRTNYGNSAMYNTADGSSYSYSNYIYHTVAGQVSIDTGVASTPVVPDAENVGSSDLKTYYYEQWDDHPQSDFHTFQAKKEQMIVNYVYVYNDSDHELDLSNQYMINLNIPYGFRFRGLANVGSPSGDNAGGGYFYFTPAGNYAYPAKDYYSWIIGATHRPNFSFYWGSLSEQDQFKYGPNSDNSQGSSYSNDVRVAGSGYNSANIRYDKKIPPYTGMRFYYYVSVADTHYVKNYTKSNPAKFTADLIRTNGYIPRLSPTVRVREAQGSSYRNRVSKGLDNHGEIASYENKTESTWVDSGPGTSVSLSSMKAGVALYEYTIDQYKVSVHKEVVKNSGEDSTNQYRTGNVYNKEDLTTDYDNYQWYYPLHDGVHRTVDGTVTWKMTVENPSAEDSTAYKPVSYGVLSDTIDSPYELAEIKIPELIFNDDEGRNEKILENVIFKLPVGDEGWDQISDGISVYTYDTATKAKAESSDSGAFTAPRIRVTRKFVKDGSIASGYDVTYGDENTDAYRYIIEVSDYSDEGTVVKPILHNSKSVDFYMTFATTDAIETNYNSFSVVFPGLDPASIETEQCKRTTIAGTHNGAGTVANAADGGRSAKMLARDVAKTSADKMAGIKLLAAAAPTGFATGGSYATEASNPDALAAEYSDWTDTSYTDALKTITGPNGDSINSRSDGNMVLPKNVKAGETIHTQLAVESVIYESENYSYFDNLTIYDLYGASTRTDNNPFSSSSQRGKSSYDVDFESIKVTDSLGNTYEFGTDYDIWYTKENLVYREHHPISPVNTLTYAADYSLLEADTTEWKKYEAGDEVTIDDAHAFKVVFKPGKGAVYNDRDDINMDVDIPEGALKGKCFIYVDFDAKVPEGLSTSYSYPNIEAYSAQMHVIGSPEIKPFIEDTTAVNYKTGYPNNIKIRKTTEVEDGLQAPETSKFKYLIIRANRDSAANKILKPEYVEAVALLELEPDTDYDISNGENLELIYKDDDKVTQLRDFFLCDYAYYYLLEIDSGDYTYKTTTGVTGSYTTRGTYKRTLELADLETSRPDVNDVLNDIDGEEFNLFYIFKNYVNYQYGINIDITSVNTYAKRDLKIEKVDYEGNAIKTPVKFELRDRDNNLIRFSKDGNDYTVDEHGDITEIILTDGVAEVKALMPGEYVLIETEAPYGYKIDGDGTTKIDTTKGAADQPLAVIVKDPDDEEVQTGDLTLNKIDAVTKEIITDDPASFEIYNSKEEGAEPLTFVKDSEGSYTYAEESTGEYYTELATADGVLKANGLPFGTYYVVETKAPAGYLAAGSTLETAREITISRNNALVVTEVPNTPINGSVKIVKVDADDESAIVGSQASFNITDEDGNVLKFSEKTEGTDGSYKYDAEGTVTEVKTNSSSGELQVTGLPQGKYSVVETKAPVGYKVASESTSFEINDNDLQTVTVSDETAEAALKLVKKWRLEGGRKTRPLADVEFTLYKLDEETNTAASIATATTDKNGEIKFEDLDWKATYYISEKVPAGYALGASAAKAYVDDATGAIDFNVTEATEGYSEIEVLKVSMKGGIEEIDNEFVYTENVLNIKNMVYGGMYGSVSYKTIDNKKAAAEYEGLEERTGYGFYYTDKDYSEGNYNYVDAVNPGDIVTYTLNVSNVSDYDFGKFSIIDRLPETGDTGVVNLKEKRDSEFTVANSDGEFKAEVDGNVVDPSMYEVSFSDKVEFTNGDFNGTTTWDGTYADAKSVRIAFSEDFILEPGQTVVVTFDGKISDEAKPGEFAWNDFAYRYTAITDEPELAVKAAAKNADDNKVVTKSAEPNGKTKDVVITPEPPKVGVRIVDGKTVIGGEKKYECADSSSTETETFTFTLTRSDELEYGVTYKDKSGKLVEFPAEGLTVDVKAKLNGDAVKFEFPELHFSHTGKYEFDVKEVADSDKLITFDSSEYHVVVDGTDVAAYTSEDGIKPVYTLDGDEVETASFLNMKKAFGDLEVSKKAENASGADKNTEFRFDIALTRVNDEPYEDEVSYTKGSEKGTLTPVDGVISIRLKAGEKAVFKDLPAGITYEVTETKIPQKWTLVRISGASGTIRDSEKAVAEFTNRYTPDVIPGNATILIRKVDDHKKAISGAVFEVYRVDKDSRIKLSHNDYSWLDSNDQFTVGKEAFSLTGLEDGTYEIREVKSPEGYRINNEFPIGFTIENGKMMGEGIVMSSNVGYEMIGDDAHQFTVINDKKGVKTGDENNILIPMALMLTSILAMLVIVIRRRKNNA